METIGVNIKHITELDVIRLHLTSCFPKKTDPFRVYELEENEFLIRTDINNISIYKEKLIKEKFSKEFIHLLEDLQHWQDFETGAVLCAKVQNLLISCNSYTFKRFPIFEHKNY